MSAQLSPPRFEGSYRPESLSDAAVMECKICWTPYDPAVGDETRSILPGTAFTALPDDWKCPNCDGARDQFMVLDDPGAAPDPALPDARARGEMLAAAFREIHAARMRDAPFTNRALNVQPVGFRDWNGMVLGVLVTPWMMALILMPGAESWQQENIESPTGVPRRGGQMVHEFPAGEYEFLYAHRADTGPYATCSLFSPMADFASQLQAVEVAQAVLVQLFRTENREETDRSADIRAAAEAMAAPAHDPVLATPPVPVLTDAPTRRQIVTGGLAG